MNRAASIGRVDSPDPDGWVDGVPTSGRDQSCAFCGTASVAWVHPLAIDRVQYRVYGKGHTLPTFWVLCGACEAIYASENADAAVDVMRSSGHWGQVDDGDLAEQIRKPLDVFRRADLGAKPLAD